MESELEHKLKRLRNAGWVVELKPEPSLTLPTEVSDRYPNIPPLYMDFLLNVSKCMNRSGTAWLLCEDDYAKTDPAGWRWNEFEIISLNASGDDHQWLNEVVTFWDSHMPVALAVGSGYAFLAITTSESDFGTIVRGLEPEFEEASIVCQSFGDLLDQLADRTNKKLNIDF